MLMRWAVGKTPARCFRACRLLCEKISPSRTPTAVTFAAGLAGGSLGGLVGLGGGVVMVPIMVTFARMTQHQAVGTSSAAVAATGLGACLSYNTAGAVNFYAAAAVASTAMVGARLGARLTVSIW